MSNLPITEKDIASDAVDDNSLGESPLHQAIAAYLDAEQAGANPDRDLWLSRYPECAEELRAFFGDHDRMQDLAPIPPAGAATGEQTIIDRSVDGPNPESKPEGPAAGSTLRYFGGYELIQEIARGGMGVVYRARQLRLRRVVAIKMILAGQLASADDVRRFQTEAEAAANLDHPGIVPIFEIGEHGGQHFFSMGFIDGQSLAAKLSAGPMPAREAAVLLRSVADAVQYAHSRGVIHRDLKPANILLDRDGLPHITDFGLAKRATGDKELTASGQILGTPSYMPPEQAAGRIDQVRERADVYSLGAMLYAMLTGRPPFQADNPIDTLLQVVSREPVPPRQLNSRIPVELEVICLKCLEKERHRRYASALELAEDLGRYLRGEPILARPVGAIERGVKLARRNPAWASMGAISILGTAAVIITLLVSGNRIRTAHAATQVAHAATQLALADKTESLKRETKTSYYRSLALSQAELQVNEVGRAEARLEQCNSDLRDWGWRFLKRSGEGNEHSLAAKQPSCAVFHPDGQRLFAAGWDAKVLVWNVETRELLATLGSGHQGGFDRMAISSDGLWVAASNVNRQIYVWSARTYQPVHQLTGHTNRSWDLSFSPDSRMLASASDDHTVRLWDVVTGSSLLTIRGHTAEVQSVAFHPGGKTLATCSWDRTVKIWELADVPARSSAQPVLTIPLAQRGGIVRYHPSRPELAIVDHDHVISVWNLETNQERFRIFEEAVNSMCYSPDGTRILTSSYSKCLRFWDSESGEEAFTLREIIPNVTSTAFSPNGHLVAAVSGDAVRVWNASPLEAPIGQLVLRGHSRGVQSLAFNQTGKWLVTASQDHTLRLWDVDPDSPQAGVSLHTFNGHTAGVHVVAINPDDRTIASGGEDLTIRLWNPTDGSLIRTISGLPDIVNNLTFDRSGQRAVCSLGNASPRIWETANWQPVRTVDLQKGWIHGADVSPDGKLAAFMLWDGLMHLYDVDTGLELAQFRGENDPSKFGFQTKFSPNGQLVAAPSGANGVVSVWSVAEKGKVVHTLLAEPQGTTMAYSCVAFSPNSRLLATGAFRGVCDVWDLSTGKLLFSLHGPPGILAAVAFSPDGQRLALGGGHRTLGEVRIVDLKRYPIPE